jgi:hypothetical protein
VAMSLFTFRCLVAIGACLGSADSAVHRYSTLFTHRANCKEYDKLRAMKWTGALARCRSRSKPADARSNLLEFLGLY